MSKEENVAIYSRNIVYRRVSTRFFWINPDKSVISRNISTILAILTIGIRVVKNEKVEVILTILNRLEGMS